MLRGSSLEPIGGESGPFRAPPGPVESRCVGPFWTGLVVTISSMLLPVGWRRCSSGKNCFLGSGGFSSGMWCASSPMGDVVGDDRIPSLIGSVVK